MFVSNRDNLVLGPEAQNIDPLEKRKATRVLFGTPTQEEKDLFAQENRSLEQESMENFIKKYNFDPVHERPVSDGQFEWSPVRAEDTPGFYKTHHAPRKSRPVVSSRYYRRPSPFRLLKRGYPSETLDNEENKFSPDEHIVRGKVIIDKESQLTTPKSLRSSESPSSVDSPSQPCQNVEPSSSSHSIGFRSHSVSNNSGLINTLSNGSLKQQSLHDFFTVKKSQCLSKRLPRT